MALPRSVWKEKEGIHKASCRITREPFGVDLGYLLTTLTGGIQ